MQPFDESLRGRNDTPEVTPEVTGEVPCKTDPRAPHGFDRNASHSADRYVCECEGWDATKKVDMLPKAVSGTSPEARPVANSSWVGLTDEEIQAERHQLDSTAGWTYDRFARAIEAKLKHKNSPESYT